MFFFLNFLLQICSVESAAVYLRSQLKSLSTLPGRVGRTQTGRVCFFLRGSHLPKNQEEAKLGCLQSLDQVNGVLDIRKPRGSSLFFLLGAFSFFFLFLLKLVPFPIFFLLKVFL